MKNKKQKLLIRGWYLNKEKILLTLTGYKNTKNLKF